MQTLWQSFFQDEEKDPALPTAKRPRTIAEPQQNVGAVFPPIPLAPKLPAGQGTAVAPNWMNMTGFGVPLAPAGVPVQPMLVPSSTNGQMLIPPPPPAHVPPANGKVQRTEHRKRKNAEYARVTRERKRNQELLLNLELASLERENERLKALVKTHLPEDQAQAIIGDCCYEGRAQGLVGNPSTAGQPPQPQSHAPDSSKLLRSDFELIESLTKTRQSFVLTDPRLPDNPIVYASRPFLALTGYTREQVLGRNCRILQGIETDPEAVAEIRKAIAAGKDGAACLLNYKADGTPFWNQFFVAAIRDKNDTVVNYVSE